MFIEVDKKVDKILNKRIQNLIKVKRKAKDKDFKLMWEIKLIELLRQHRNKLNLQ
jgi:hypothetical protein